MNDVFVSYEHESKVIADNIVAKLESHGIRCWYAPRDVIGDYATSIVDAITNSKVFILLLNGRASNSPHVLNEVEIAYKMILNNEIIILPFKINSDTLSMAMEYYVKRLHWIDAELSGMEDSIKELLQKVLKIIEPSKKYTKGVLINQSRNWDNENKQEIKRLSTQAKILSKFDMFAYNKAIVGKNSLKVLDVGSNNGSSILHRLGKRTEVTKIIGLEKIETLVNEANEQNEKLKCYLVDIDQELFEDELDNIMVQENIEKFDLIVCSLVLHHVQNVYKVLRILYKKLKKGGSIIISDIDDDIVLAYPDREERFNKTLMLNKKYNCHDKATRLSGRRNYGLLKKAGFNNIVLEKSGYSNEQLNSEEKEMYYYTCFYYILNDLERIAKSNPNDKEAQEDYLWLKSNYNLMEQEFMGNEFFYFGASMLFTAIKE